MFVGVFEVGQRVASFIGFMARLYCPLGQQAREKRYRLLTETLTLQLNWRMERRIVALHTKSKCI